MKKLFNIKTVLLFSGIYFLLNIIIAAQNIEAVEVGNVYSGEIEFSAFKLLERSNIKIEGSAGNFGKSFSGNKIFYGWIIDSKTRQIVWDARETMDFEDEEGMFSINDQEFLEAGNYEVYYTCNDNSNIEINSFGDFVSRLFSRSKKHFKRKYRSQLGITVIGEEGVFYEIDPTIVVDSLVENSIASFTRVGNNENLDAGFSIRNNTKIKIYSIGEARKNKFYDVAWISNVRTNKIVWIASDENTEYAGGVRKNYLIDQTLELPKGTYLLNYTSDDSHSFEEWNALPPDDPQFWGVTIWAASEKDQRNVIPFREEDVIKPVVELIKVGDDEFLSQGFSLDKNSEVTILCLGEGHKHKKLRDYGWIINADTKEIVWSMNNNENIKHAGGSTKNVMVEETLDLRKGNYLAFFSSDDSHSYEEWNSTPPYQKEKWGLTIWADKNNVKLFNEKDFRSKSVIVEIIRVREDENIKKEFVLSKDVKVRILALGEGDRSEMDDYGWIEDENGNTIWEMSFGITRKGGGAKKNRMFNGKILLNAGKYFLHYKTDDSHSYNSWNSSPPENQENYGITLMWDN